MRKRDLILALSCGFLALTSYAVAEETNSFTGSINMGTIFINSANNLNPNSSESRIDSLDNAADKETTVILVLLPQATWTIGATEGTKLYFNADAPIDEAGSMALNFGFSQSIPGGVLDTSLFVSPFEEAWENPYLTEVSREETASPKYGIKMGFNRIAGTGLRVNMVYMQDNVDDDLIGEIMPSLARDGEVYAINANYSIQVTQHLEIRPRISLRKGEYDGDANSFSKYKFDLEARYLTGRVMITPRVHYSYSEYDEVHPIFNETRENNEYGFELATTYMAPFDFKDWAATILVSLSKGDSNIDFFDTESITAGAMLSYKF
ncbi:DUF2860 family protein [Desulfogranum japonicum]|uniref:DUF2860 family protein n=1 Tax=Desulfogranum japonicum TaxID=231447 RepID=UPI00041D14A9|nr:DUF2860 family protein [Desulfogranum japonicum]